MPESGDLFHYDVLIAIYHSKKIVEPFEVHLLSSYGASRLVPNGEGTMERTQWCLVCHGVLIVHCGVSGVQSVSRVP